MKAATRFRAARMAELYISIHAAREGGDAGVKFEAVHNLTISIHAAREGGDCHGSAQHASIGNFNPRRP